MINNSCIVIGSTSLSIKCLEILEANNIKIKAIWPQDKTLLSKANDKEIEVVDSLNKLKNYLQKNHVDYLFSIANYYILPPSILQDVKQANINYHDSLLPKYAGPHATSWAILNKEKNHGISWHYMTVKPDSGDIIKQKSFLIEDDDNVSSLNAKCYEHAIIAFNELIADLQSLKITSVTQDTTKRDYYFYNQKPAEGGVLIWNYGIDYIRKILKATEFGEYPNRLASPKILVNTDYYSLYKYQIVTYEDFHNLTPGQLLDVKNRYIDIYIEKDKGLRIEKVFSPKLKKIINAYELACTENIYNNMVLKTPSETELQQLTNLLSGTQCQEAKALQAFSNFLPVDLKLVRGFDFENKHSQHVFHSNDFTMSHFAEVIIATSILFIKLSGKASFLIERSTNQASDTNNYSLMTSLFPFNITGQASDTIEEINKKVQSEINNSNTFLYPSDIFIRYPGIKHFSKNPFSMVVTLGEKTELDVSVNLVVGARGIEIYKNDKQIETDIQLLLDLIIHIMYQVKKSCYRKCISKLSLLRDSDKKAMKQFNNTPVDYYHQTLQDIILHGFENYPHNIAVLDSFNSYTFSDIYSIGLHFSNYLIGYDKIAILMPKSPEQLITAVACALIGITFIPLSTKEPVSRINSFIVTTHQMLARINHSDKRTQAVGL